MTRAYRWSPEGLRKRRERMKALHADPAFAAATRERMKALNADHAATEARKTC